MDLETLEEKLPEHVKDVYQRTVKGVNGEERKQVAMLLIQFADVFSTQGFDIGE